VPREASKTFTDRELEIMRILWKLGEAGIKEIQARLPPGRHYNTVLTIVRVLERKGHVTHRERGRGFAYSPAAPQQESRLRALGHIVDNMFGGSSTSMVLNLVETGNLTLEDLDVIRAQVRRKRKAAGR